MKENSFNLFLNAIPSYLLPLPAGENSSFFAAIIGNPNKSFSILLAKASFVFLLISMFFYWFQITFKFDRKTFLGKIPYLMMWSANMTLAILLFIRWIESGHFPLSNLYESLLFLSWSLTTIHLFLEDLLKKRNESTFNLTLGAITSPVALFTNAFATFSLPQEMQKVTVLVPALQSNWLMMHVSVMIISYAALLSGSLLAVAFLVIQFVDNKGLEIKNKMSSFLNTPLAKQGGSTTTSPVISIQTKGWHFLKYIYKKNTTSETSSIEVIPNTILDTSMQNGTLQHTLLPVLSIFPDLSVRKLFVVASEGTHAEATTKNRKDRTNAKQQDLLHILDNLSYRTIGLGFALLTIGILSGAVWANEAWGSYWSWDPKETWAFVTWLIFALYLHTRLSKGWVGKESAFVATFGFLVIWFCYLGVNLFGKGLHSYGWFHTI